MPRPAITAVAVAAETARTGISYSSRYGARCPWCGARTRIYKTCAWEEATRVRYHRCANDRCSLARLGVSIKSVEFDPQSGGE